MLVPELKLRRGGGGGGWEAAEAEESWARRASVSEYASRRAARAEASRASAASRSRSIAKSLEESSVCVEESSWVQVA